MDGRAAALCGKWGRGRASRPGVLVAPGGPRRGSGCRPGWRAPSSLQGEECVRDRDERDVVVPAAVGAAFEVIETERVFELAIVVLDPPAQLREPNELLERRVRGEIGEPVLGRLGCLRRPFAEQPVDWQLLAVLMGVAAQV